MRAHNVMGLGRLARLISTDLPTIFAVRQTPEWAMLGGELVWPKQLAHLYF